MRIAVRQLAWLLVLLAVAPTWSAEPVHLQDGGYRFDGELYQATVDPRGAWQRFKWAARTSSCRPQPTPRSMERPWLLGLTTARPLTCRG